jgi:hypothetical protein
MKNSNDCGLILSGYCPGHTSYMHIYNAYISDKIFVTGVFCDKIALVKMMRLTCVRKILQVEYLQG